MMLNDCQNGMIIVSFLNKRKLIFINDSLNRFFKIPMSVLPEIRSSSEVYGYITQGPLLGVPISGVRRSHY